MGLPNEYHETITAGLRIVAERPNGDGTYSPVDNPRATSPGGTISALAKDSLGRAVVVTNLHVITALLHNNPRGGEKVYHHEADTIRRIGTVPAEDLDNPAWVERLITPQRNKLDACYAVLDDNDDFKFVLHGHAGPANLQGEYVHTERKIVSGTYDPVVGDTLLFLGRNSGEHEVTISSVDEPGAGEDPFNAAGFDYHQMILITSTVDLLGGDSGAGLFKEVRPDEYQLACIFFANFKDDQGAIDKRKGYACKASEVATALGITFGNRPPVAIAGYNQVVAAGSRVELTGASISDEDPEDRGRGTPLWSQKSGTGVTLEGTGLNGKYFTAPAAPADLIFELKATDPYGLMHTDEVRVRVSEYAVLPTRVMATAAARSVALSWRGPSIATGYKVEIGIPPSEGGLNHTFHDSIGTSITIGSLTPQTTYEYRVRMTNSDGVGPWTAWATVATLGETPPTPTPGQWSARYLNNRIQVKITELPATTPAIDQVKAKLGISPLGTGLGSDTITVTRDIGARLNRWVDVLTDADSEWQMGTWTAQIRFENTVGESAYSAGKTVVVTPPNNPPVANAGYNEVARANTRVTLSGAAGDPDASDQDDLSYRWSKRSGAFVQMDGTSTLAPTFTAPGFDTTLKFRLTVTDPHGAKDTDNVTVWVYDSLTSPWHDTGEEDGCGRSKRKRQTRLNLGVVKFRWRATPEPVVWTDWEDTGETRNEATGAWTDTGSRRENPVTLVTEKEQTRAITWEKEQERTNQCDQTGTQWVDASRTETQWVEGLLAPTNVTATPSTRSVELSWDAVSGATGYEVEIGIPGNAGGLGHTSETTTDTTITISNLIPEKTYEYRVRGTTTRVDGPWTDWATVVTEGEEPPQPTNDQWKIEYDSDNNEIQAKVVSLPTVIPAISEVRLHMGSGQPPNRTTITKAIGTDLDTWVTVLSSGDTGWATDVTWAAHIRFENSVGNSRYSLPGEVVTVPAPLPPLVENVTADPAFRSVELSWDAASGATGYEVEIGIPASAGGLGHTSHTTTGTSITVSSLNPAQTYEYRVRATNAAGDGPWTDWATVVTEGEEPPQPTSDQWNFRYSSNKLQAKVISLPTVTPAITEVELTMETGQPPNLNTVTKNIGTSLDTWVDVLTRGQTGWTTGTWIAQIRFRNSVDYGPYSDVKSDTVPTVPTTPDPDPCTWRSTTETRKGTPTTWTHVRYSGCGPDRRKLETRDQPWEKKEECVLNGVVQDTRWVYHTTETEYRWLDSPEPYRWRTVNDGSPTTTYTAWTNLGEPYPSGSSCKQVQIRQSTTVQRRKQVNHCNDGVEKPADPVKTTTYQRQVITVTETWGNWSYTGGTDYDDIEDIVYYEQERYSYPCNRRDTRWVTTRPS